MKLLAYDTTGAQLYTTSQQITRVDNCNGFTATNMGDDPVRVNDQLLYPGVIGTNVGDSMVIGGNYGEVYMGRILISFEGTGANPSVSIIQKFYLPNC